MAGKKTGVEPKNRESYTDKAYREIKNLILENQMPAGHQVMEQELSELLQMSRTPTREALVRLANEGLIEIRPRHGMRVKPVSPDDMREIYEILTALESTAAALAAQRNLSPAQINEMKQAVSDMDTSLETGRIDLWAEADEKFHKLLVEFSGNERLQKLVGTYIDQVHRIRILTLKMRPKPIDSNKDHRAVLDAIERADAESARHIHRTHRERNGRMLVDILIDHGLNHL